MFSMTCEPRKPAEDLAHEYKSWQEDRCRDRGGPPNLNGECFGWYGATPETSSYIKKAKPYTIYHHNFCCNGFQWRISPHLLYFNHPL
jgi:hypothetical protein